MRKHLAIMTTLLLSLFVLSGCILDPKETPDPPIEDKPWPDLKEKDNIFAYLEKVYEDKNADRLDALLDDNFTFIFSLADYNDGITPDQWKKNEELGSARNMFNNYEHPKYGAITGIDLQIDPQGLWLEVPMTEPPYEGETWYQKTAGYYIIVETTSEWTLQGSEKNALFTVRQVEDAGETIYRIILWNDDVQ